MYYTYIECYKDNGSERVCSRAHQYAKLLIGFIDTKNLLVLFAN